MEEDENVRLDLRGTARFFLMKPRRVLLVLLLASALVGRKVLVLAVNVDVDVDVARRYRDAEAAVVNDTPGRNMLRGEKKIQSQANRWAGINMI